MLKSKLRKTGVCRHLRTQSLENACYSSTTCPTLSTLFLQNVPDCPPEALSFLPRFARFYSIYYIQAVAKTHFLQVKNFIPPTEKHRVLRAAGGQKQPQISAQIGSSAAIFPRGFGALQAAVHARIRRRFRALRTLVSGCFLRRFLPYYIWSRFHAERTFSQMPMRPAAAREEQVFPHSSKRCTAGKRKRAVGKARILRFRNAANPMVLLVLCWFCFRVQDVVVVECFT